MSEQAAAGQTSQERGESDGGLSRVEAFSDGVFAIAITLLVLQIELPSDLASGADLWQSLKDQSGDLLAFAISFAVIGRFWVAHHQFVRQLSALDGGLIGYNLVLLAFVVLVPFFSQVLGEYGDFSLASILYAGNLVALSVTHALIYGHALNRGLVRPEARREIASGRRSWLYNAAVFGISMPLAIPLGSYTPLLWLLLAFDPFNLRQGAQED